MTSLSLHPSRAARTAAAACALLALACSGSDGPTPPTSGDPVNVAQLFGELATPGLASATSLLPAGVTLPTAAMATGSCPYDAASKSFVCPPVRANGITVSTSYVLLDAAGKPLDASADRRATATMRMHTTVAGTLTLPASSGVPSAGPLTISGTQEMTFSGLLGPTHTLNGTATTKLSGSFSSSGNRQTAFTSTSTQTTKDLVFPAPTSATATGPQYPTSGTVTVDGTTTVGTGTPAFTTRVVMTFNGTSTATLTITSDGFTQRCTVDLAKPSAPACTAG